MPKMRNSKQHLKRLLQDADWQTHLEEIAAGGMTSVGPLFSFLLLGPLTMHRAAAALGATVARLAETEPEAARNVIRRFMWHMNEDSGNIGWGIPDAFAECLAASEPLAESYHRILISYIMDLGHADNYCDNDILRRSCYWAVGRLGEVRPEMCAGARPWLRKGLEDVDSICRGMAAWALARLPEDMMDAPALRRLAESGNADICEIYEAGSLFSARVDELARAALMRDEARKG
ncbi:MAG: HEAT repeat domain-containing protein [Desulfovibrio sp.]|nr:HEAT repeat domain-containing protein [Desulfovibrio sp.]